MKKEKTDLQARIETEARAAAHALIQRYLGHDHKVLNMPDFYAALVQALKAARGQGKADR